MGRGVVNRFGQFTLDIERRSLQRGSEDVHLTPKAFDLLHLLVDEAPRVLPKTELHERLWPGTFVSDATLSGLIKELRKALDDRDSSAPIIRTMHRVGYALACDVQQSRMTERLDTEHWLVTADKRYALSQGENVIGRDPGCAVWLDSTSVSRRHARIAINDTGVYLEDLGSKNGTRVGTAAVGDAVPLRDGDRIVFGSVPLTYRISTSGLSTETHVSGVRTRRP